VKKALGLAFALSMALTVPALAEDMTGTIASYNPSAQSFTLEDGTQLWLQSGQEPKVTPGDRVLVTYEVKDGKKVIVTVKQNQTIGGAWPSVQEVE
jgi:hypothetical protein